VNGRQIVKIYATNVTFVLLGTDGAIKSYYYMEVVRSKDERFEVTKARRVN
jgi:hypothetical protein